jgi:membrane protein implicated in regulation of membrane protease activity
MGIYGIAIAIIVAGITFLVVADVFTGFDPAWGHQIVGLLVASALLIVLGPRLASRYSGQGGMFLKHVAIWLAIIAVLALIYQNRAALGLNID